MLLHRPDIARHVRKLVVRPYNKRRKYSLVDGYTVSSVVRQVAVRLDALNTFEWDGEEMPPNEDMWFALRML